MSGVPEPNLTRGDNPSPSVPPLKRGVCTLCQVSFGSQSVVEAAVTIADHWNDSHGELLSNSYNPYGSQKLDEEHSASGEVVTRTRSLYLSHYDVLGSDSLRLLDHKFVESIVYRKQCRDCGHDLEDDDDRVPIKSDTPRSEYRCQPCAQAHELERRKSENHRLFEFTQTA